MIIFAPLSSSSSSTACARAAPWAGSVPDAISSRSRSASGEARLIMVSRVRRCEENDESPSWTACWSPIDARTCWKRSTRDPSCAGTKHPCWTSSAQRPTAFSATVFPPAFGPEITSAGCDASRSMSLSTGATPRSTRTGCRTCRRFTDPSDLTSGRTALISIANFSRAAAMSRCSVASTPSFTWRAWEPREAERSLRMRNSSAFSSPSARRSLLFRSITCCGSM
mmetsp:Transcript_56963/g.135288  ORF Transcript_56963/g.135288 Transcript_56963/m.135288 type:complete len:225 (-) Transcript_56963:989-1663(-)